MSALFIGHKGSSYTSAISGFDHEAQPGLWVMVRSFFLGKYLYHDLDDGIVGFAVLDGEGSNGTSASSVFNPTATVPSSASIMGVSVMCGPALIVQLWTKQTYAMDYRKLPESMTKPIMRLGLVDMFALLPHYICHLIANSAILVKLRKELKSLPDNVTWMQLEQLPYLSAAIEEGSRLALGITARVARISYQPLTYTPSQYVINPTKFGRSYVIPQDTAVSTTTLSAHVATSFFRPFYSKPE
ncbi:hypothetical protein BGAL_0320g00030 [Botrytis galanthina]|uniref:Peptidase A1 domain-containing protein n=1 Tax=Botrytis galanthina TaxID=278940 RepID=A0A4S8QQB8_9HELO|nr:hypothetical protein BGAL_0320g00030 [Botrytis galanthina]